MDRDIGGTPPSIGNAGWSSNDSGALDLLRVVLVRKWILVCTFVVCMLGMAVYLYQAVPVYRSSAMVLIEMSSPDLTRFQVSYDPPIVDSEFNRRTFLETQYQIVRSRPLVEKTFHHFKLENRAPYAGTADPVAVFQSHFTVTPVRKTQLAHVAFDSNDPELAARIVDFHVNLFRDDYKKRSRHVAEEGLKNLKAKANDLKPQVEASAQALQRFKVANNMISLDRTQDIIVERMKEINRLLVDVEKDRIRIESKYKNIENAMKEGRPLEQLPEVVESSTVRDLKLELVRARQESRDLDNRFGPNHPEVRAAAARLTSIEEKMRNEVTQVLAASRAEFERITKQETELEQSLEAQQAKVMEFNGKSVDYAALEETNKTVAQAYRAVIQRIEEVEITVAAGSKENSIVVISEPHVPLKPIEPRKRFLMGVAAMAGLFAGLVLCYLREFMDKTIHTRREVETGLGLPVAGTIPRLYPAVRGKKGNTGEPDLESSLSGDAWYNSGMQSFTYLESVLANEDPEDPVKTLAVTSPSPGDGKSLISLNLAIAMARAGKKVLLVDADMRRPRLSRAICPGLTRGLSTLLSGEDALNLRTAMYRTEVKNLFFLPSGRVTTRSCSLLAHPRMARIVKTLERAFDCIVFDTPPLAGAMDAAVLGRKMQAVLLVIRAFKTRRDDGRKAGESLLTCRCPRLAAVINEADAPRGAGHGHGGYYYTYYPMFDETQPEGSARSVGTHNRKKENRSRQRKKNSASKITNKA